MIEFLIGTIFVLIWLVIVPLVVYLFLLIRSYKRNIIKKIVIKVKKNGGEEKDDGQNKRKTAKKTQIRNN